MSEGVFRETLSHLPLNGPSGQEGLSYWIRRNDLLLVFVYTSWSGLGGEGHVETTWLREVLRTHADARYKMVLGHHPVHPVNGFSGAWQREIGPEHAPAFWDVLVEEGVLAYLCGHILAFDVQVHLGVLQICTAGAGTAHRMPEGIEYLHCVQAALDGDGLRYQVFDTDGSVRERLAWPLHLPPPVAWHTLSPGPSTPPLTGGPFTDRLVGFRFTGRAAPSNDGSAQTLVSADRPGLQPPLWIGLRGADQRLAVVMAPEQGRSPHYWHGPTVTPGAPFDLTLLVHTGMGPGGMLCRMGEGQPWSSLAAASPWGAERLEWPEHWSIGRGTRGLNDQRFRGAALAVSAVVRAVAS
jgi:hypothetical protein